MTHSKEVKTVDEYSFRDTDYVTILTRDGWLYRFVRPSSDEDSHHPPYRYDRKQRPDGEYTDRRTRTPQKVVEFMEAHYDCAQLHPETTRTDPDLRFNA